MKWAGAPLLGLAAAAIAAPRVEPRPTWADWVGDYEGKLAWKGCLTPGAARARISLDAIDGAMVIELVDAGGGLRAMSLVEEEGRWTAQSGDVKMKVERPRANTLYLDAEISSDCRMQAQLVRPSTKIAACDRLVAWARVEARCNKLGNPPTEDPAKLAKESVKWKPRSKAVAARCEERAETLETLLVAVGCAPVADPQAFVPGPRCLALDQALAALRRCGTMPRDRMNGIEQRMQMARTAGDPATRAIVEQECDANVRLLAAVATNSRCPL